MRVLQSTWSSEVVCRECGARILVEEGDLYVEDDDCIAFKCGLCGKIDFPERIPGQILDRVVSTHENQAPASLCNDPDTALGLRSQVSLEEKLRRIIASVVKTGAQIAQALNVVGLPEIVANDERKLCDIRTANGTWELTMFPRLLTVSLMFSGTVHHRNMIVATAMAAVLRDEIQALYGTHPWWDGVDFPGTAVMRTMCEIFRTGTE